MKTFNLIGGTFFAILTVLYLCFAAWAQWFTNSPNDWKPPICILCQALLWALLSYVFYVGDPDNTRNNT